MEYKSKYGDVINHEKKNLHDILRAVDFFCSALETVTGLETELL